MKGLGFHNASRNLYRCVPLSLCDGNFAIYKIKEKKKRELGPQYGRAHITNSKPQVLGIKYFNYLIHSLLESVFYLHRAGTLFSTTTAITDGNHHDTMDKGKVSMD